MAEKTFSYTLDGLSFTVRVFEARPGVIKAEIAVTEGAADFNALLIADADLNGRGCGFHHHHHHRGHHGRDLGHTRFEGERVDWDDVALLSRPTFSSRAAERKQSFLEAGESMTVRLHGIDSLDDVAFLGVRATHATTGRHGVVRAIAEADPPPPPPPAGDDDFPALAGGITGATFYFAVSGDPAGPGVPASNDTNGDGIYAVRVALRAAVTADPDEWFQKALDAMVARVDIAVREDTFLFGVELRAADGAFDGAGLDPALVAQLTNGDAAFFAPDGDPGNEAFPKDASGPVTAHDASINFDEAWLLTA